MSKSINNTELDSSSIPLLFTLQDPTTNTPNSRSNTVTKWEKEMQELLGIQNESYSFSGCESSSGGSSDDSHQ